MPSFRILCRVYSRASLPDQDVPRLRLDRPLDGQLAVALLVDGRSDLAPVIPAPGSGLPS